MTRAANPDFLNGVPELLVLRLLLERPMYGYELVENIARRSTHVFEFGEGCLYPILHKLERDGALTSERSSVQGRVRRVYSVTPQGQRRYEQSAGKWRQCTDTIAALLKDHPLVSGSVPG